MNKQSFYTAAAAREYLVGLGFAPFRKGQLTGTFTANGRTAQMGYGLLTRTGQSSRGAGAIWGFTVTVK